MASDYTESSDPYNIEYVPGNVYVNTGYLHIVVPARQTPKTTKKKVVSCGEIQTVQDQIQYAVVKTTAMLSSVPGTCQGKSARMRHGFMELYRTDMLTARSKFTAAFFYSSDTQECDIEYISDPNSPSNPSHRSQPLWLQYTNQPGGNDESYATSPTPNNANASLHEYRIDWLKNETQFYTDGELTETLTDYVPSAPGQWVWNNWSNGDSMFTVGP